MDNKWFTVNTSYEETILNDVKVIRVVKNGKINEFDENTYVKLANSKFQNGIIEVEVLSRLLEDAPDFARGFIGIAFHINNDDSKFESFYIRPTNGRIKDPIRKNRACQYFAYPNYTFDYFREHEIKDYEAPADIGLDEWIRLKVIINDIKGEFYVNGKLVLTVDSLINDSMLGDVGIFVDTGTEGFFKNLKITTY